MQSERISWTDVTVTMNDRAHELPPYTLAFRLAALVAIGIALYHSVAFFYPAIGKIAYGAAYFPGYPARRHLFWAVTFASLTGLLLWRARRTRTL
jgi:hypothetical protein